jgi:hypothetical protein
MEEAPFVILGLGIIIYAIIHSMFFTPKAIMKRKIRRHLLKDIGDVQEGELVRIKGKVVLRGKTLSAPLSDRKCCYYHVIVVRGEGKESREIINEKKAAEVIIQTGEHFAFVHSQDAATFIDLDVKYNSGFLKDATPALEKFLKFHGHKSEGFFGFNKTLEYKEGVLEEGETTVVAGKGRWVDKSKLRLDLPCQRVLVIEAEDHENPVRLSDDTEIVHS